LRLYDHIVKRQGLPLYNLTVFFFFFLRNIFPLGRVDFFPPLVTLHDPKYFSFSRFPKTEFPWARLDERPHRQPQSSPRVFFPFATLRVVVSAHRKRYAVALPICLPPSNSGLRRHTGKITQVLFPFFCRHFPPLFQSWSPPVRF